MSNATEKKHRKVTQQVTTTFGVTERRIPCPHSFQLYVDYGTTPAGPWLKIGINETELGIGYLPKPVRKIPHLKVATTTEAV
jgi:hypothetical protein